MTILQKIENALLLNSSRVYLESYNREFARLMKPGTRMLDAGSGSAPYKKLFSHVDYENADFEQVDKPYAKPTYVCDLCERVPAEDGRFQYIVFNQTLEHLKEPERPLRELYRVLAPGGRMICTVPLFYEEHEQPYDFFRYTQFSLAYLFSKAGFQIERIEWMEGFFGTCGYMLQTILMYMPWRYRGPWLLSFTITPLLLATKVFALFCAAALYRLDLKWKITNIGFPKNYVVIAAKPTA
jgi:SAM-dependent methyltransferase